VEKGCEVKEGEGVGKEGGRVWREGEERRVCSGGRKREV
jgi:hypothetical protein